MDCVPNPLISLRIKKNYVVDTSVLLPSLLGVAVCTASLPDDLRAKVLGAKYPVENNLRGALSCARYSQAHGLLGLRFTGYRRAAELACCWRRGASLISDHFFFKPDQW